MTVAQMGCFGEFDLPVKLVGYLAPLVGREQLRKAQGELSAAYAAGECNESISRHLSETTRRTHRSADIRGLIES